MVLHETLNTFQRPSKPYRGLNDFQITALPTFLFFWYHLGAWWEGKDLYQDKV